MKKKTNQKKLILRRESLVQLREPNIELADGGATLRCNSDYWASCVTCSPTVCTATG